VDGDPLPSLINIKYIFYIIVLLRLFIILIQHSWTSLHALVTPLTMALNELASGQQALSIFT
jgi:hypothetical protein